MIDRIKDTIIKENLIKKNENVLLALSGGPDSVFLFHILRELKDKLSFVLYASHINHMYRGVDANKDEQFVTQLCEEYGIKLFVKRKNATEYAKELKLTEEEAGRKLRYDFFNENLSEIGGGVIAVAHNLDDQCETVLQRIIRGTGIDGLAAMSYKNENIIRPILDIKKKDILEYLNFNSYNYCIDYTNQMPIYGRNKVRLNLIPYIEENFNPNIQNVLFRMSRIMEKDSHIIKKYIDELYKSLVKEITKDRVIIDLELIRRQDKNEAGRVIRRAIYDIKGDTNNLENKHIDYAVAFIFSNKTGQKINIANNIVINISYNELVITKSVEKISFFEYNIIIGKTTFIQQVGKYILLNVVDAESYIKKDNEFFVDYDTIKGTIKARNRKNSDFIIPFGMSGKKKLKDIFIDNKIPQEKRDEILILEDEEKIIWVENFRISNECRASNKTKKILTIKIMEDYNG